MSVDVVHVCCFDLRGVWQMFCVRLLLLLVCSMMLVAVGRFVLEVS